MKASRDYWCEGEAEAAQHDGSDWERAADHSSEDTGKNLQTSFRHSTKSGISQFLEQRYGFFHCRTSNIRWESAYVWCISGTCKVYYKQLCRKCQAGLNPYRVEPIICKLHAPESPVPHVAPIASVEESRPHLVCFTFYVSRLAVASSNRL